MCLRCPLLVAPSRLISDFGISSLQRGVKVSSDSTEGAGSSADLGVLCLNGQLHRVISQRIVGQFCESVGQLRLRGRMSRLSGDKATPEVWAPRLRSASTSRSPLEGRWYPGRGICKYCLFRGPEIRKLTGSRTQDSGSGSDNGLVGVNSRSVRKTKQLPL